LTRPLRVAIVGAGPAGFYTAAALLKHPTHTVHVDLFDRLPAPYGLVRAGVAPDHQKIKGVVRAYRKTAGKHAFRFFGNVALGRDLTVDDLERHYDQWVISVGSADDRKMGIPGEALAGSHSARQIVAWYNGHPDHADDSCDLTQEHVVVIGVGNVAVDVARILTRDPDELAVTDIAGHAMAALRHSQVKTVTLVGRRGPVQAAFTSQELKELDELDGVDVIVKAEQLELDPISAAAHATAPDKSVDRILLHLADIAERGSTGAPKQIRLEFLASPTSLEGAGAVRGVQLSRTRIVERDGWPRPTPTGETFTLPAGLVFRAIGYRGKAIPGVPFDDRRGIIPNDGGRILDTTDGAVVPNAYVAGWAKRGPTGVIGTNRADANDTVAKMFEDLQVPLDGSDEDVSFAAIDALLAQRDVDFVTWDDWEHIDALEQARGQALGKVREKFIRVEETLAAVRAHRNHTD